MRLVIPLILGIICEIHSLIDIRLAAALLVSITVVYLISLTLPKRIFWIIIKRQFNPLIFLLMVSCGILLSWMNRGVNYPTHFSRIDEDGEQVYIGRIVNPPQEKAKSVKAYVEVENWIADSVSIGTQGRLLMYFEKSSKSMHLEYGDRIVFRTTAQLVNSPANPLQFNFKEHLANNDIYHQAYVKDHAWRQLSTSNNSVKSVAFKIRRKFLRVLKNHIVDDDDNAVASALILGYKDDLDPDVVRKFSSAGAMHVLAVSGLHVGIVFLLLNTLLKFMERYGKYGIWIRAIVLLIGLWTYAFVTGLSPSVQRAATMFSFIVIGAATSRPTNIYNTLSASAFLLIILDPLIITKVGFQLSYLAVVGIVYLQPKLYDTLYFKNVVLDKVWAITCVSFAAQAATFPLGLYYFHQFPNYFFVSNLIVIPMATVILYGGMVLFLFDWLNIAEPIAWLLNKSLHFLNQSVAWVEDIPYSLMYGNHLGLFELLLFYTAILLGFIWLALKRKTWFWLFAANILIILLLSVAGRYSNARQNQFIVYQVPGKSVLNFISGKTNFLMSDDDFLKDDSQQLYFVKHNWFSLGYVKSVNVENDQNLMHPDLIKSNGLIQFNNLKVYLFQDPKELKGIKNKCEVDVLVLSGDNFFDLDIIENKLAFDQLVVDSSVPKRTASIIESLAKKRNWQVHNVHKSNAYILER